MSKNQVSYHERLLIRLKNDPDAQQAYLQASLEENSDMPEAFLLALRTVAEANGFQDVAKQSKLNRESLYKALPTTGRSKPRFDTIVKILGALDLRLAVVCE